MPAIWKHFQLGVAIVFAATVAASCSGGGSDSRADNATSSSTVASSSTSVKQGTKPPAKKKATPPTTARRTTPTTRGRTPLTAPKSPPKTLPNVTTPEERDAATAYTAAFASECRALWSRAGGDGLLWDPENLDAGGYAVDECLSANDKEIGASYGSATDAAAQGKQDADQTAMDLTISGRLARTGGTGAFEVPQ